MSRDDVQGTGRDADAGKQQAPRPGVERPKVFMGPSALHIT
jgi:hypothetical protein